MYVHSNIKFSSIDKLLINEQDNDINDKYSAKFRDSKSMVCTRVSRGKLFDAVAVLRWW